MSIFMIGIDHNMAPVDVRAQFAFTRKNTGEALRRLKKEAGIWLITEKPGYRQLCYRSDSGFFAYTESFDS